jgi:hypothetical protein
MLLEVANTEREKGMGVGVVLGREPQLGSHPSLKKYEIGSIGLRRF